MVQSGGIKYKLVQRSRDDQVDETKQLPYVNFKKKILSQSCFWSSVRTTLLISLYFGPSIGLTFYQRWLLKDFHFPLTVVLVHLTVKFILAASFRELWNCINKQSRQNLPWRQFVRGVGPTGIASALDVGLSNWGLELAAISLYSITKSTTIIFILIFAVWFKLEKKSWSLVLIVILISGGLIMFNYKSVQFNLFGFLLLLLASLCSGIRWTCAQLLMQKSSLLSNPIDMIYHVQPWMLISVLPLAIAIEGPAVYHGCRELHYSDIHWVYITCLKVFIGAILAFGMECCEYLVVTCTSSLTLSIAGIFKEIIIVTLAVIFNGDKLSLINTCGLVLCLAGISSHIIHKIHMNKKQMGRDHELNDLCQMHDDASIPSECKTPLMAGDDDSSSIEIDEESDSQVIFNIIQNRDK